MVSFNFPLVLSLVVFHWFSVAQAGILHKNGDVAGKANRKRDDVPLSESCEDLKDAYAKGYLSREQRSSYCFQRCDFLKVNCEVKKTVRSDIYKYISDTVDSYAEGGEPPADAEFKLHPEIKAIWLDLIDVFWPVLLSLPCVLLSMSGHWPPFLSPVCIVLLVATWAIGILDGAVCVYDAMVMCACYCTPKVCEDCLIMFGFSAITVITILVSFLDIWGDIVVFFIVVIGFSAYFCWVFLSRRKGSGVIVMIALSQVCVLEAQLSYMNEQYANESLIAVGIRLCICAVFPDGTSLYYAKDAARYTSSVMGFIKVSDFRIFQFGLIFLMQCTIFLGFRALIGAHYIYMLRCKVDPKTLSQGLYIYMTDIGGPMFAVFRCLFGHEKFSLRRLMYVVAGFSLSYHEFHHALGFFICRIFFMSADLIWFKTGYTFAIRNLEVNVDFQGLDVREIVWPDHSALHVFGRILRKVDTAVLQTGDAQVRRVCVVLKSGVKAMLYTLSSSISPSMITRNGKAISKPSMARLTDEADGLHSMGVSDSDAEYVNLITKSELADVAKVVFVNVRFDRKNITERSVSVAPWFKVDRGNLDVTFRLDEDELGGPAFTVMRDGSVRFCGMVTRGSAEKGASVQLRFAFGGGDQVDDLSDGNSIASGGSFRQFEGIRRVKFASDDPERVRISFANDLNEFLNDHGDIFVKPEEPLFFKWQTIQKMGNRLSKYASAKFDGFKIVKRIDGEIDAVPDPDRVVDSSEKGESKRAKKKRKKLKRDWLIKTARHVSAASHLKTHLLRVYSEDDAKNIYYVIVRGVNIPKLDDRRYIFGTGTSGLITSDALPEPGIS